MNITTLPKPEHGEQRNWRIESESTSAVASLPGGEEIEYVADEHEYSASERYCASCDEWVTAAGIIGGLMCPKCKTSW